MGVLVICALLFGVSVEAPDFWKLPKLLQVLARSPKVQRSMSAHCQDEASWAHFDDAIYCASISRSLSLSLSVSLALCLSPYVCMYMYMYM